MYILSLLILLTIYFGVIYLMKYMKNVCLWNFIFVILVHISYFSLVIKIGLDVGLHDWNFKNTLLTANVSPFMFTSLLLFYVLPKKIKKYYMTLISLLSVGFLLAVIFNASYFQSINYSFHYHFLFDYIAHLSLSLLGIYFIRSGQIDLSKKSSIIGGLIIITVAIIMMVLNIILDTSFFGLSLNGKHNIYNNVIVAHSYISALIYYCGLSAVLFLGYLVMKFIKKKIK